MGYERAGWTKLDKMKYVNRCLSGDAIVVGHWLVSAAVTRVVFMAQSALGVTDTSLMSFDRISAALSFFPLTRLLIARIICFN